MLSVWLTIASHLLPMCLSPLLLPFCLTYLTLHLALPHPFSFLFSVSCKWRNTSGIPVVMSSIFSRLLFVVPFPLTFPPPPLPFVCQARCATVVWQPGSFPTFPFDASWHISLEQASAYWEQNSCLVSALHRLAFPTFTHYPFPSFCSPLCPFLRFKPILLER